MLQKCWTVVERALTYGACPTYTPFLNHNGNFVTDLTLPYWGDIMLQPGKKSDSDSNYIFMRSWWQTKDIEALIDKERSLARSSKKRGDKEPYKPTWNVDALKKIKNMIAQKDIVSMTPAERDKAISAMNQKGGVEFVTGFQRGVDAEFITFHPPTGEVLRVKTNKDPRGEIPISFMYSDTDASNPFGRGIVELVGPLQNLMDSEMQMYQYNRALMLNPPLIKRGNFNKNKVKFEPNIIIDVGSETNANVEALKIDSAALVNFPNNYGMMKTQLLNLLSSPDTSTSAAVGNPGFSKTPAGVNQINANVSVDDNYVLKQFETWFRRWSETAINIYFAERTGIEELQLDKVTASKLRDLRGFDQKLLSKDDKVRINYDDATEVLTFRVNPSTTSVKDQQAQEASSTAILDMTMKYPQLNSKFGGPIDIDELGRKIVLNSGIEDPEQVAPEPTEAQIKAKEEAKNKVSPFSPMFDKPHITINYGDVEDPASRAALLGLAGAPPQGELLPMSPRLAEEAARGMKQQIPKEGQPQQQAPQQDPTQITPDHVLKADQQAHSQVMDQAKLGLEAQKLQMAQIPQVQPQGQAPQTPPQQGITPEDQPLIDALKQAGANEDQIGRAVAMLHHNIPIEEIIKMLQGVPA